MITTITQSSTKTRFQITREALEVLASNPTDRELGELFEDQQFSPELEEYLFLKMDSAPENQSYVEVVKEEVSKLSSQREIKLHLLSD